MKNPVYKIIESGQPFVYFHTRLFGRGVIDAAKQARKSLEIDVSVSEGGELIAAHPPEFYKFKQQPFPEDNLPPDTIIHEAKTAGLFLVLDCKDERALPWATQTIKNYGANNVLFHSWVTELTFKPFPPEITSEPHWAHEDLPLDKVLELKQATGVPVISAVRGLTKDRLQREPGIIDKIIDMMAGKIDAINLNLPGWEAPPPEVVDRLLENNLLSWLFVDNIEDKKLPPAYIGASDQLDRATDPLKF